MPRPMYAYDAETGLVHDQRRSRWCHDLDPGAPLVHVHYVSDATRLGCVPCRECFLRGMRTGL